MVLDKQTREAVIATVRKAAIEMHEVYEEQWLTSKELCNQIGFFSMEWLKRYGQTLPRECVRVTTKDGVEHKTGWCYPKMRILRMINEGSLRSLSI